MPPTVECARPADIPRLVELMARFYAESNHALDPEWAAGSFGALLANERLGRAWIARRDSEAVGYVVLTLRHSMEYGGLVGAIDDLFVCPEARRGGVGKALLAKLFEACRHEGVLALSVETGADYHSAGALYRAFGFEPVTDGRIALTTRLAARKPAALRIRPAHPAEVDALDRIALAAKAHWGYTPEQLATWSDDLRTPGETLSTRPTLVAELDGEVVGFAQVADDREPWELVALWVLPAHMRKGIGRALLQRLAALAKSRGQACLHIDSDPNAAAFYVACGAAQVGLVPAPIAGEPDRARPQLRLALEEGFAHASE